jgi:hypothetical protein
LLLLQYLGGIRQRRSYILDLDAVFIRHLFGRHAASDLGDQDMNWHSRALDHWLSEAHLRINDNV